MADEKIESSAEHFLYLNNYCKCQLFYCQTGTDVISEMIRWHYNDRQPLEEKLVSLEVTKSVHFNSDEKTKIENFKNGFYELSDLDFSLLFKIIQTVCGLKPRNDNVWTKHCPKNQREELEYLLFKLKVGRNSFAHPGPEEKNITYGVFHEKFKEIKELLSSIVWKGGQNANVPFQYIEDLDKFVLDDLERICKEDIAGESLKAEMEEMKSLMERKLEEQLFLYNKVREQLQRNICAQNNAYKPKYSNQVRVVNVYKKVFMTKKKTGKNTSLISSSNKPNYHKQTGAKTKVILPKQNGSQQKARSHPNTSLNKPYAPNQNPSTNKHNPSNVNSTQTRPNSSTTNTFPNKPRLPMQNITQTRSKPANQNNSSVKPHPPKQNPSPNKTKSPKQNATQSNPNSTKQNTSPNKPHPPKPTPSTHPPRKNATQTNSNIPKQNTSPNKPHPPKQNHSPNKTHPPKQNDTQANPNSTKQNTSPNKPHPPKLTSSTNQTHPPRKNASQTNYKAPKQSDTQNKSHLPRQNTSRTKSQPKK